MKVLNLKNDLKEFYQLPAKKSVLIDVPKFQFVMIDGRVEKGSEPGGSLFFAEAAQGLYGISYTPPKKTKTGAHPRRVRRPEEPERMRRPAAENP